MPVILDYIIKVNICFAVVYLFYQLLLRRLTFYNWNRWYLLGYTVLSFIIPLINVMPSLQKQKLEDTVLVQWIPVIGFNTERQIGFFESLTLWDLIIATLALGSFLLLFRLIIRLFAFAKMKAQAILISDDEIRIYQLDDKITPFSFGNAIFINTNLHDGRELEEIIRHEFVHVKQKHSVDIIWCELLSILNWFNPFVWLIRHNVRQNLEFLADDKVLQTGLDKKVYQYLLLKVIGNRQFAFTNQFNFSSLKKRIVMMNSIKTTKLNLMRFLFLLPVIAVLLLSFRNEMSEQRPPVADNKIEKNDQLPLLKSDMAEMPGSVNDVEGNILMNDTVPETKKRAQQLIGVMPGQSDTNITTRPLYIIDGIIADKAKVNQLNPNNIDSVSVYKGEKALSLYGAAAKNGVVQIVTRKNDNLIGVVSSTETGQVKLKKGDVELVAETILIGKNEGKAVVDSTDTELTPKIATGYKSDNSLPQNIPSDVYYVLNGKHVTEKQIKKLAPNSIMSVDVLKGTNAIKFYGKKAKNGAIVIVTK